MNNDMWSPSASDGLSQEDIRRIVNKRSNYKPTIFLALALGFFCGFVSFGLFAGVTVFKSLYHTDLFILYVLVMIGVNVVCGNLLFRKINLIIVR